MNYSNILIFQDRKSVLNRSEILLNDCREFGPALKYRNIAQTNFLSLILKL